MKFVVKTQILENYGAADTDGRFADGNAYWKMKGGNEYIVRDVERHQDAMAFVMAKYSSNTLAWKEFPVEVITWEDWQAELNDLDDDYKEFLVEQAISCSPIAA